MISLRAHMRGYLPILGYDDSKFNWPGDRGARAMILLNLVVAVLSCAIGFMVGVNVYPVLTAPQSLAADAILQQPLGGDATPDIDYGAILTKFTYNRTFGSDPWLPSPTEDAWASLVPRDATLEHVDPDLGGVTGWGGARLCRNYSKLVTWAEKHRVNNLRGFLESAHDHA
ncbi:putative Tat pathway signal sequence [Seiridium cardinale]